MTGYIVCELGVGRGLYNTGPIANQAAIGPEN